ncbi:discoidin domain-containing protein [Alkalimonas collagenimarina]|uniref:Discoidin domain-containing protein n=1 Tax=Alkalimonas collagenimarina TaxID=400390 RepID=A0ABT9H052_9GAMM|nr:discoidin domain-containing protein [Alkalimonas collagenimarina]MDP4536666.1 discoidin domain-containing protein [Alkalimonas collagenimarina]
MKTIQQTKLALSIAVILGALTGCDAGDDPDVQDAPTPVSTSVALSGQFIKGTLSGAELSIQSLSGTTHQISGSLISDQHGMVSATLNSAPGYAFNGLYRASARVTDDSQMICDAVICGDIPLSGDVDAALLGAVELHSLMWLRAPLGSTGSGDTSFQINALTHLATVLVEAAMAEGRNISALATFEPAQQEFSTLLLRILGVDVSGVNLFELPLVSAESLHALSELSPLQQRLTLVNAAFAGFAADSTLADTMLQAKEWIQAASTGDVEAASSLRQQLVGALQAHPVLDELGLTAEAIIDVDLSLEQSAGSTGPIRAYTGTDSMQGAVITGRGAISEAESEQSAFDGSQDTKWLDDTGIPSEEEPSWIQVQFQDPVAVSVLAITSANDAPDRDPENFSLLASHDGEHWFTLGDWAGAAFDERFETKNFSVMNSLPFQYYRLNISKNRGDSSLLQLAEIEFFGPVYPDTRHVPAQISARGAIGDAEAADMAFDGDINTKWLDNTAIPTVDEPSWVQVDYAEPVAVANLALTSANDAPDRDPENFSLLASNDGGASWTLLAEWAGESFDDRFQRRIFPVGNGLAFSSYRLNISKNKGDTSLMQVAEIELLGPEVPALNHGLAYSEIRERGAISAGEAGAFSFDGDPQSKWLDNTAIPTAEEPSWVEIELPEPQAVTMLGLLSANDAPDRDPENFSLQASHDGSEWFTLGHWAGVSFEQRFERQVFPLSNLLGFQHYRLNITKNKGDTSLMQVAEVELIGPQYQAVNHSLMPGISITERARISDSEAGAMAFDNNAATKWLDNAGVPTAEEPAWVEVVLPEPVVVSSLAVTSANDAPSRDPENFRLLGSQDGSQWTLLGDWAGESFDQRFQRREFPLLNGRSFSHYRIEISKNKGDDSLMQVANFELIGL